MYISCVASMTSHNPHTHARMHRDTRQRHVASVSSLFSSFLLHVLNKTVCPHVSDDCVLESEFFGEFLELVTDELRTAIRSQHRENALLGEQVLELLDTGVALSGAKFEHEWVLGVVIGYYEVLSIEREQIGSDGVPCSGWHFRWRHWFPALSWLRFLALSAATRCYQYLW